jgi:hypothetical protein
MERSNRRIALHGLGAAALLLVTSTSKKAGAADGINRLIMVTALKAEQASDDANKAADKQRELVRKQSQVRDRQREIERLQELEAAAKVQGELLASIRRLQEELAKAAPSCPPCRCADDNPKRQKP